MPRPRQIVAVAGLAVLLAGLSLAACGGVGRAARTATGFASHQLCSAVFVSGLDADVFYAQAIAPVGGPIEFLLNHAVDRAQGKVTASMAGMFASQAVYRGETGCIALHEAPLPPPLPAAAAPGPALLPTIAGAEVVAPADPRLAAALDRAFAETAEAPHRNTQAVVVLHDGRIIAERYAPGIGIHTRLAGWSMTKSVTNALIGILIRQGRLSAAGPAPVAAWADPADPRHAISVDNLLRMTSGLDLGDSIHASAASAFDTATQTLFGEDDMAGVSAQAPLAYAPGSHWQYADGNTLLLSRLIRDQAGGDAAATIRFARRELFDKLGMRDVTLEFDAAGTPIGSSHMFAAARDWARLGQFYLDDGVVGGERLLPEGWTDYSARLTPGSETYGYGAGFWTNRGDSEGAKIRIGYGLPADAYMARGSFGQYVVIVPSARLVVVRLGPAFTARDDMEPVAHLVAETIATLR